MYAPKHFAVTDRSVLERFIRENGFASLVTAGADFPVASHIPVNLDHNEQGDLVLQGHLSKANPQWQQLQANPSVLVIFLSSIHSYISSSWYAKPNVPTWNYMSVQVSGRARLIEGEALWKSLSRLTDKYEQGSAHPVTLAGLPPEVQKQINGIVGFEISIEKIEGAFKLSQNRTAEDFSHIIQELRSAGEESRMMADAMENAKTNQWT